MGLRALAFSIAAAMLAATGCSGDMDEHNAAPGAPDAAIGGGAGSGGGPDCVSARAVFAQEVWTPVFDKICLQCHSSGTAGNADGFAPKAVTVKVARGQKLHLDIQLKK